jgi:hypothetical protein
MAGFGRIGGSLIHPAAPAITSMTVDRVLPLGLTLLIPEAYRHPATADN